MNWKQLLTRLAGGLTLAVASAGCATTSAQEDTAETIVAPTGPALWQVSDEDTTIYLFGTVHLLPQGLTWYEGPVANALAASEEYVTEIDMAFAEADTSGQPSPEAAQLAMKMAGAAMFVDGRKLTDVMTDADRKKYAELVMSYGIPAETFDRFEPWFSALTLSMLPLQAQGYDANSGVEVELGKAVGDKKRTALESVDEQIAIFDSMPMDVQLRYLNQTVEGAPNVVALMNDVVKAWKVGDVDKIAKLMINDMDDGVADRLLLQRNDRWADWIAARMDEPGTVFVAVGAGHLAAKGSVQDELAERGLTVTRVQ